MSMLLIRDRFPWMGEYSGYDRLVPALKKASTDDVVDVVRQADDEPVPFGYKNRCERRASKVPLPFYNGQSAFAELTALRKVRSDGIKTIHLTYVENQLGWLGQEKDELGFKLIGTAHQPPEWWNRHPDALPLLNELDGLITLDKISCAYFESRLQCRVHMIPHGVDTAFFKPALPGEPGDTIDYLCVGSWLRDKKHLAACADAIAQAGTPARLHLVSQSGHPVAGPTVAGDMIRVHTDLSDEDLLKMYQQCHALVLPLTNSTANNTLMEAMACGMAIVLNNVGGVRTYTDGVSGIWALSRPDMLKLLRNPPAAILNRQHSAAVRAHATTMDWSKVAEATLAFVQEVGAGQPAPKLPIAGVSQNADLEKGQPDMPEKNVGKVGPHGPEFICIGAQKAGTSYLHAQLAKHPRVSFPHGKEVHYWDQRHPDQLADYFPGAANPQQLRGDITPAYAILPEEKIEAVFNHCPDARIIFIIRNPIERSFSHERMDLRAMQVASGFGVSIYPKHLTDEYFFKRFNRPDNLQRSDYERCLRNWRQFYPADQILTIKYDLLAADPLEFLKQICGHLELGTGVFEARRAELSERIHGSKPVQMRPALHEYLQTLYRPKIESLAEYLQQDLSDWLA